MANQNNTRLLGAMFMTNKGTSYHGVWYYSALQVKRTLLGQFYEFLQGQSLEVKCELWYG